MEDSSLNFEWPVSSIDDQLHAPLFEYYEPVMEPQLKTHSSNQSLMNQNIVQGGDDFGIQNYYVFNNGGSRVTGSNSTSTSKNTTRVPPCQDHILAERKRREILSQRFIALSALLPNLKKLDKASVLGDAIEYMKTLQEKVKILEDQTTLKQENIELVRFKMEDDGDEISLSDEKILCVSKQFPEIEARVLGKDVLIRVYCQKKSGVVENTLAEIEKLNLSVSNSTSVFFGNSMLHITVIAQMDKDLTMSMKDFVKNLRCGFKQFM